MFKVLAISEPGLASLAGLNDQDQQSIGAELP
jgi:hypothetical protein